MATRINNTYVQTQSVLNLPGGGNTMVQFNNNGKFGGDNGLKYNNKTKELTVQGNVNVGGWIKGKIYTNPYNFFLTGGTNGQVLSTDGYGNLSWVDQSGGGGSSYGNANVASYLPTYTGNINASNINNSNTVYTSNISATGTAHLTTLNVNAVATFSSVGNVVIPGGTNGQVLTTNGSNVLSWTSIPAASSSLTVGLLNGSNVLTSSYPNVTTLGFDSVTGFNVTELAPGNIKVSLGSSWKTWEVAGQDPLIAVGEDTVTFVAGTNMSITTDANAKTITFNSTGGGGANTGNVTFDNVTIQGDNSLLNLSAGPDFTANLAYLRLRAGDVASHIHLDTANNDAYDLIIGNDQKNVQVSSTGNIVISSYDNMASSFNWTFDNMGYLTIPGLGVVRGTPVNMVSNEYAQLQWIDTGNLLNPDPNDSSGPKNWAYVDVNGFWVETNINQSLGNISHTWFFDNDGALNLPSGDSNNIVSGQIFSSAGSGFINLDVQFASDVYGGIRLGTGTASPVDVMVNGLGGNVWRFGTNANFVLPSVNGTQKSFRGTTELIYGDPFPGSTTPTPTTIWTASSNVVIAAKMTVKLESYTNNNTELFDVTMAKEYPNSNVSYTVTNRLKTNDTIADANVSVDLDGSDCLKLIVDSTLNGYFTYNVTEFNHTFD